MLDADLASLYEVETKPSIDPPPFTEHGVAMLSSVLNSKRAVQVNLRIIRAFIALRETLEAHKDLARKIEYLQRR